MTTVTYVSQDAPSFSLSVPVRNEEGKMKRVRVKFENKHLSLNPEDEVDAQIIKFLDDLIEKRPDVSSQITKVSREAALKVAAAHIAAKPVQSHTGPTTSMHNPAFLSQLEQRGRELRMQGVSEDDVQAQLDQMKTELQLTAPSAEVVRDKEGFIPSTAPAPITETPETPEVAETPEAANPKAVFSLGSKGK